MFHCQHTGKLVGPNVPEHRVVVERRHKTYENVIKRGKHKGEMRLTEGWEIVKEIRVCPQAYQQLTGLKPRQVPEKKKFEAKPIPKFKDRGDRFQKKWRNPKKGKKQETEAAPKKKPVVQVVSRLPKK